MASIITAVKNSLFFTIFSIPGIFLFQLFQDFAATWEAYVSNEFQEGSEGFKTGMNQVSQIKMLSLAILFFLVGIPLFKFLSDTVEDGVVEF